MLVKKSGQRKYQYFLKLNDVPTYKINVLHLCMM